MTKLSQKAIAAALASRQLEFDSAEAAPTDGATFVTHVADAPLQVMGRLERDGQWRITAFLVPTTAPQRRRWRRADPSSGRPHGRIMRASPQPF
jgi:hypothetical protein